MDENRLKELKDWMLSEMAYNAKPSLHTIIAELLVAIEELLKANKRQSLTIKELMAFKTSLLAKIAKEDLGS